MKPKRDFKVGDRIRVNMHAGKIVDATIKAVMREADGIRLQVDFGFSQTALIYEWQVVED
jgi:small-conductance mechanosensitive channel